MEESYCIVDKRVTPCTEPLNFIVDALFVEIKRLDM